VRGIYQSRVASKLELSNSFRQTVVEEGVEVGPGVRVGVGVRVAVGMGVIVAVETGEVQNVKVTSSTNIEVILPSHRYMCQTGV